MNYYSIGIGQWSHFYTLRLNCLQKKYIPSKLGGNSVLNGVYQGTIKYKWKIHHVKNLSQDYDEALSKAKKYAANYRLELKADIGKYNLNEIRRRDSEEKNKERELQYERHDAHIFNYDDPRGLFFYFGKYKGENVYDVLKKDQGYLEFLAENSTHESILLYRIKVILERVPALVKLISHHVGEVKERLLIHAELVFAKHIETHFGSSELLKFQDSDGNLFVAFYSGCKLDLNIGDTLTFKGTVKKHDEFRGEKQTLINRIKICDSELFTTIN